MRQKQTFDGRYVQLLVKFQQAYPDITTETWGFYALRRIALKLNEADLRVLLPSIPTPTDFADLGLRDIKPIVITWRRGMNQQRAKSHPPPGKIAHNRLSQAAARMLTLGMAHSPLLKQYMSAHSDKTYGDRMAALFRAKYEILAADGSPPRCSLNGVICFAAGSFADQQLAPRRRCVDSVGLLI